MLLFINYWSLESMSVIIWVSLTCTWDQRPAIVIKNLISTVTNIKILVRGLLSQHDTIKSFFMRDEFDIEWIKFVYQIPYLSLVTIEVLESTEHEISHQVWWQIESHQIPLYFWHLNKLPSWVLELGPRTWNYCLYIQILGGMRSSF